MALPGLKRLDVTINPDRTRVLIRPMIPSEERVLRTIARVMALSEDKVRVQLRQVLGGFGDRHHRLRPILLKRFERVRHLWITDEEPSIERRLLIGAYFTQEYSYESAALFNPSIVPHPDQRDLPRGSLRFILSLRATGEGHVSSIAFRSGTMTADDTVSIDPASDYVAEAERIPNLSYVKTLFERKLAELDLDNDFSARVMGRLPEEFEFEELCGAIDACCREHTGPGDPEAAGRHMAMLAESNYETLFPPDESLSERAIFPSSPSQSNGIEDARFVRFEDDDGSRTYYATFTAYDGRVIIPQLVQTDDFLRFRFITLNGAGVRNKGMALFPRKIDGNYAMISRQDGENVFLMYSDNIHFWYDPELILRPTFPWEFVQLGNCGSPVETDQGWLVLSHGVGPMRRYCIGAFLLDKHNPARVIGRLPEPLLEPNENEREGYVPNVVYTCGCLVHGAKLIIPYAMSDYATTFATVPLRSVVEAMV